MKNTQKTRRAGGIAGKLLIAAVIVSLLAVTASAAEYLGGWFVQHFTGQSGGPLSNEQIEYIGENVQPIQAVQPQGDWTVELRSAMNDGTVGYVVLAVTAPENVDLTATDRRLDTGNPRILEEPEGVNSAYSSYWEDDGDGKANTHNYVMEVYPNLGAANPFGPQAKWAVHIEGFRWELWEPWKVGEKEVLTDCVWDFDFRFTAGEEGVELIQTPVKTTIDVTVFGETKISGDPLPMDEGQVYHETEPAERSVTRERREVTITSFILEPLSAKVVCDAESFVDLTLDWKPTKVVMKDGTSVALQPGGFNMGTEYTMLQPAAPIVLSEVDHIQFPDGTAIPMP